MQVISREAAKARGLKRYFTGAPCKRGHIAERHTINGYCIVCLRENGRAFRKENPESHRRSVAKWTAANADKKRDWEKRNPDKMRAKRKRWEAKHPEKLRSYGVARYHSDPDRLKIEMRRWREENPDRGKEQCHRYRARKLGTSGSFTADDVAEILKAQRGKCAACRVRLTAKTRRIDHIIALARGGSNDRRNLQILCHSCNSSKGARDPLDFARDRGLLM